MSAQRSAEVMRRYLEEVVGKGDIALLDDLTAEDMIDQTAMAAGWGPGRAGLVTHVNYFRQVLPDISVSVERVVASDDDVVGIWRVRGTHSGDLFGFAATGKQLDYTNASVFRLKDGKIVEYSGVWGALEAVQQMGKL